MGLRGHMLPEKIVEKKMWSVCVCVEVGGKVVSLSRKEGEGGRGSDKAGIFMGHL